MKRECLGLAAGGAGDAVRQSRRCERVGVDGEMLWGSPVPQNPADGKVLLCPCYGAVCEPERMKDVGEGGWMEVTDGEERNN